MKHTQYIVSTTCGVCNKRGRKCAVFSNAFSGHTTPPVCDKCLEVTLEVLTNIHRNVTTLEDLA